MVASVTRLRVRSLRFLPPFVWKTLLSQRQVVRAPGFFGGRLLIDSGLTFWTLTVWEGEHAMKAFRGAGEHARAMSRLAEWCNEAAYAHWVQAGDTVPTWDEAHERLVAEGRLSRVGSSFQGPLGGAVCQAPAKPVDRARLEGQEITRLVLRNGSVSRRGGGRLLHLHGGIAEQNECPSHIGIADFGLRFDDRIAQGCTLC